VLCGKHTSMKKIIILIFLVTSVIINGQDRLFTYTYQSTVLSKGQKEIEIWNTIRTGRSEYYSRLDHRTEFEIGLGGRLQTAFYLNLTTKSAAVDENLTKVLETENEIGFSNEWKLKLLDPVANPLGLALYGEYGISSNEYELEGKLIIDKQINKFVIASNAVFELEMAPVPDLVGTNWEKEKKFDLNLALAYHVKPSFAITIENIIKNVYVDNALEHSALYAGPGFSFASEKFWLNCTLLPQLKSFKGHTNDSLNLNEFEKIQIRLLFSYVF
jgi:hypothetical protein